MLGLAWQAENWLKNTEKRRSEGAEKLNYLEQEELGARQRRDDKEKRIRKSSKGIIRDFRT